jgi:cytochrome oxidase Cu insertion factor (SCO1/SenC/PrrC family)
VSAQHVLAAVATSVVAAALLGVGTGCGSTATANRKATYRGSEAPEGFLLPAFVLSDERGQRVRSRDLLGKVVLLTFLDSQCTESCPVIAFQLARTLEGLAKDERLEIVAVAISTDPAEDTRASVMRFLVKNRALRKVHYLGGGEPVARLRPLWKRFQILSSLESGKDALHSAPVRIYDRRGRWVATQHAGVDLTTENLLHDIRVALRAGGTSKS